MSLQVWLPLNGDLHNQGLDNTVNVTNTGATINNTGKIGQCYEFAANKKLSTPINIEKLNSNSISFACWIYVNSWGSSYDTIMSIASGTSWNNSRAVLCRNNTASTLTWNIGNNSTSKRVNTNTSITLNTWTHIAATYDGQNLKIYLNGILDNTIAANLGIIYSNTLVVGAWTTNNNYPFNGKINDVRIYNHCLSAKEIEEIAKGLILHYKLDNITQPNLLSGNPNFINAWVQDGITLTQESDNSLKCVVTTNTKRIYNNVSNVWTTIGNTYTVSFLAKAQTNGTEVRASRSIADYAPTFILTTDWKYYSAQITITATSISGTLSIQGVNNGDVFWLRNIKLEKGSIATHYLLPNDIIDIIYDSSGYNNNGTIVGSLETTIPGPRYSCATKMTNGQYIRVNNRPNACMPKDAITVNLWQYATSWSNPISCTEGGGWNFENNNGIRFPVYISGVGYKVAQSSITPASTQNAWHMLTGTMDKDNIKIYYDGEEVGTVANGSTNGIGYANNYIFIGAEAQGNNTSPANSSYTGNLSDIRIYATALTPEQIKELYNTSMTIDNNGNIHARELVE